MSTPDSNSAPKPESVSAPKAETGASSPAPFSPPVAPPTPLPPPTPVLPPKSSAELPASNPAASAPAPGTKAAITRGTAIHLGQLPPPPPPPGGTGVAGATGGTGVYRPNPPAPGKVTASYGQPPKKPRWGLWLALGAVGLFISVLFFGFMMLVFSAGGASSMGSGAGRHKLHEQVIEGSGQHKIAVIRVEGVISDIPTGGGMFGSSESLVDRVMKQLDQASADPDVKAIVLVINTPGGGVTASDVLYNKIKQLHDDKNHPKKLVVHMGDICASGGYYISAPCDVLVASPTTITGSIGVIMSFYDAHQLFEEKLSISEHTIKSGPHKDIGSMFREPSKEDLMILQGLVNEMYGRFLDIVIEGRGQHGKIFNGMSGDEVKKKIKDLADGRIYTGEQAFKNGLVDKIGYLEDAYEQARLLTGLKQVKFIEYRRLATLADIFSGEVDSKVNINHGVQVDLGRVLQPRSPLLEFRWKPQP